MLRSEEYIPTPPRTTPSTAASADPAAAADDDAAPVALREKEKEHGQLLPPLLVGAPRYGFNRQYSGVFAHLREEMVGVLRLEDPESTPEALRTEVGMLAVQVFFRLV